MGYTVFQGRRTIAISATDLQALGPGVQMCSKSIVLSGAEVYRGASIGSQPFVPFVNPAVSVFKGSLQVGAATALETTVGGDTITLPQALKDANMPGIGFPLGQEGIEIILTVRVDAATPAVATGSVNMNTGALYGGGGTLDGLTLAGTVNSGSGAVAWSAPLGTPANSTDVTDAINGALSGAGISATAAINGAIHLTITTFFTGATIAIAVTASAARTALGLPASATGSNGPDANTCTAGEFVGVIYV